MFTLLYVFILKVMDCSLGTLKTVFLVKDRFFISSLLNSLSAALFIFVADAMANAPSEQKLLIAAVIFLANVIGGYVPPKMIEKMSTDRLFVYVITSQTFDEGKHLADTIREKGVAVSTSVSYNDKLEKVLVCNAYAKNRHDSRQIESVLSPGDKFHIVQAI